jgi:SAM-dependent methyltransferase
LPTYDDLPAIELHPHPEIVMRGIIARAVRWYEIESILDVGSGHGGVFDYDFWTRAPLLRRATCDIHGVRDMGPEWETTVGVDVQRLTDFYEPDSFDFVQCMEVLEHVPDSRAALVALCTVARRLVLITSADELHHGYDELGNFDESSEQARVERVNPHQRYIAQPLVSDLHDLGFEVAVEAQGRRQLVAWRALAEPLLR